MIKVVILFLVRVDEWASDCPINYIDRTPQKNEEEREMPRYPSLVHRFSRRHQDLSQTLPARLGTNIERAPFGERRKRA